MVDLEVIANTIYKLQDKFGEERITVTTIHLLLREVIELVDKFSCQGSEKREHVVTIVKAIVNDLVDNDEEKRIILEMIDKKILENTIDLIILATKGELNINNKQTHKKIASCCKSIIPLLISSVFYIINSVNEANYKRHAKKLSKKNINTVIASQVEIELNK